MERATIGNRDGEQVFHKGMTDSLKAPDIQFKYGLHPTSSLAIILVVAITNQEDEYGCIQNATLGL